MSAGNCRDIYLFPCSRFLVTIDSYWRTLQIYANKLNTNEYLSPGTPKAARRLDRIYIVRAPENPRSMARDGSMHSSRVTTEAARSNHDTFSKTQFQPLDEWRSRSHARVRYRAVCRLRYT